MNGKDPNRDTEHFREGKTNSSPDAANSPLDLGVVRPTISLELHTVKIDTHLSSGEHSV